MQIDLQSIRSIIRSQVIFDYLEQTEELIHTLILSVPVNFAENIYNEWLKISYLIYYLGRNSEIK
jgi:hypothetical protein